MLHLLRASAANARRRISRGRCWQCHGLGDVNIGNILLHYVARVVWRNTAIIAFDGREPRHEVLLSAHQYAWPVCCRPIFNIIIAAALMRD